MLRRTVAILPAVVLAALPTGNPASASTAAFQGTVAAVGDCPSNASDCLRTFTVRIEYFDYISWGKFGRESKVGESITRQVRNVGTACVLDGELTNASTLAKAFRPGLWGYFYEDTWLNLRTTPEFTWGELVSRNDEARTVTLRLHATHKDHHIDANPPVEKTFSYVGAALLVDGRNVAVAEALKPGSWIQIHEPRGQTVLVRTASSAYDPTELLPAEKGKRGFANDLTRSAVLEGVESDTPEGVIDVSARIDVRNADGESERIEAKKVTFVLDGKVAPVRIANRPGSRAVLCYYRSEKRPHKVFVESADDAVRGTVADVKTNGDGMAVEIVGTDDGKDQRIRILLEPDASLVLDGVPAAAADAVRRGRTITIHPARGRTFVCFPPAE